MAVIGRYILSPNVLRNLDTVEAGAGGEIQLTDAIAREIEASNNVYGFRFKGRRFDCGSKSGYLQATVAFGLARPDLREEFLDFIRTIAESETAAPTAAPAVPAAAQACRRATVVWPASAEAGLPAGPQGKAGGRPREVRPPARPFRP
jgi:hypothetical protein